VWSKLISIFNKDTKNVHRAALLLGAFSLFSQLLGLLRDRLLASNLGPSASLDVYYAAFKLPDFLYASFASLFSMTVLIPFITKILSKNEDKEKTAHINRFLSSILSVYLYGMAILCITCFILMPCLAHFLVPGFSIPDAMLFVQVSRVLLLSPFFLGLSNLLGTFSQIEKKFFAFALSPVLYNIGILCGVIFLLPRYGVIGIVVGVVVGAILHFLTHYAPLKKMGIDPNVVQVSNIDKALVKDVVMLSIPRTIGLSLNSVSFLIISGWASLLAVGTLSLFQLSYNIQTTPLMIIGISYAVASFPTLSAMYAEKKFEEFKQLIRKTIRTIIFLSLPLCLGAIVLGKLAVKILLGGGHFSAAYIHITYISLIVFSISFAAQSLILVLVRGFYAIGETKIPLKINLFALFLMPLAIYSFLHFGHFQGQNQVFALVGAYSLVQIINALSLYIAFKKKMAEFVL
jgi:putative peptidoglycan lipid II flippase